MTFNLRTRAARNVATAAVVAGAVAGFCAYEANDFRKHRNELPCERLNLPKVAGAEPISENICIAVSGERPKRVGVESAPLPNGKVANTIFLEWDYDGFSEVLKHVKPDAEPVTLVTDRTESLSRYRRARTGG